MIRTDSGFFTFTASLWFDQLWRFRRGRPTRRPTDQPEAKPERQRDERSEQPEFALAADQAEEAAQRERQHDRSDDAAQYGADEQPTTELQSPVPSQRQLES